MAHSAAGHAAGRVRGDRAVSGCTGKTGAYFSGVVDLLRAGLFTLVVYIILAFVLDPMPDNLAAGEQQPSSGELLDIVDKELAAGEKRLREMERYVTSDTFTLRSRFRQL